MGSNKRQKQNVLCNRSKVFCCQPTFAHLRVRAWISHARITSIARLDEDKWLSPHHRGSMEKRVSVTTLKTKWLSLNLPGDKDLENWESWIEKIKIFFNSFVEKRAYGGGFDMGCMGICSGRHHKGVGHRRTRKWNLSVFLWISLLLLACMCSRVSFP